MNDKNYEYLKEQLLKTGFGTSLNDELKQKMQVPYDFTMFHSQKVRDGATLAVLHFNKSQDSDYFFLNKFLLNLQKQDGPHLQHTFPVGKGHFYTLKEGYNLLDGRSVYKTFTNKENEKYQAWVQLKLEEPKEKENYKINHYHKGYGYDLDKALQKLPLKVENEEAREKLVKGLQKGNVMIVTLTENGQERKAHLEASPQYKNIIVYDQNMKREFQQHKEQTLSQQREDKREHKQALRNERKADKDDSNEEKKRSHSRSLTK